MRVVLTKLSDQRHALEVERADRRRERVELETRSCLNHDFTHFAVEEVAGLDEGFFGSLAAGRTFAELTAGADEPVEEYSGARMDVERSVAVLQGMAKNVQRMESPALVHERIRSSLAPQDATPPAWFPVELVTKVQERLRRLLGQWRATPYGGSMELTWTSGRR